MMDLLLRYTTVFLLHAAIGFAAIVLAALLAYGIARLMGWTRSGARGLAGLPAILGIVVWCVILLTAVATGLQTGGVEALSRAIRESATESSLTALVKLGGPIGIRDADQRISLQDAERLAQHFAPALLEQGKSALASNTWLARASGVWARAPELMKTVIQEKLPDTQTSPRQLVHMTWQYSAGPIVESGRQQALVFAYGSGLLVVLIVLSLQWCFLAWTRSTPPQAPAS